jgi:Uncharacterized protein conserved in bacteria
VRLSYLGPIAILVSLIGAYSLSNRIFDVWLVLFFGLLGYFMRKGGFDVAPFIIAFILGPIMERAFRQSLLMSQDGVGIFAQRPISLIFLILIVLVFTMPSIRKLISRLWRKSSRKLGE